MNVSPELLDLYTAPLELAVQRVLRHPSSFTAQLGKQSTGVVCYLAVTATRGF